MDTSSTSRSPRNVLTALEEDDQIVSVQVDQETFEIPRYFFIEEMRGSGGYGVVLAAKNLITGENVAIKKNRNIFSVTRSESIEDFEDFDFDDDECDDIKQPQVEEYYHRSLLTQKRIVRELKILAHLNHPNIVSLKEIIVPKDFDSFKDVYYCTELMEADLKDILMSDQTLTERHIQYFMYQLLLGVYFMHSANILHRDLKPENLLVNSDCQLKICDFGLARAIDFHQYGSLSEKISNSAKMSTPYVQTRFYRAPELLLDRSDLVTMETDMWSVGCIFAELLLGNGQVLFKGSSPLDQMQRIISIIGKPSRQVIKRYYKNQQHALMEHILRQSDEPDAEDSSYEHLSRKFQKLFPRRNQLACDLLARMLHFDHEMRISAEESLKHPYFSEFFQPTDLRRCQKFDFSFEAEMYDSLSTKRVCYDTLIELSKDKRFCTPH